MKAPRNTLMTALAVAIVALALLAPIAAAGGPSTGAATNGMMGGGAGSWCGGGIWSGSGQWGGTGMWGSGFDMRWLTDDPAALQAWLQLRTEHQQAMRVWYDTYKADLTTPAAQQALHDLWTTFWNDMKSFYEQYADGAVWTSPSSDMWGGGQMGGMMGGGTWNAGHMWGTGYGASWMIGHPAGLGRWLALRDRQMNAMDSWWQHHGSAPGTRAAQAALQTLHVRQRAQVRSFYGRNHLPANGTWMRYGAGGWMGLGGMWGGFGW
jgi:hypothetical protein